MSAGDLAQHISLIDNTEYMLGELHEDKYQGYF